MQQPLLGAPRAPRAAISGASDGPLVGRQLGRMRAAAARRSDGVGRATARRRRPLSRRAAPGGSTSPSARAIVEQYSAAIHSASATRSAGTPSSSARSGREQLLVGDLARVGQARRPRRAPCGGRTAPPASSRRPRPRAAPRAAGSRTARAARGPSSSARPGRSQDTAQPRAGSDPAAGPSPGQRPAAARSASALSVRSQVKSWSSRPKWP